jgi:hypothetical protein
MCLHKSTYTTTTSTTTALTTTTLTTTITSTSTPTHPLWCGSTSRVIFSTVTLRIAQAGERGSEGESTAVALTAALLTPLTLPRGFSPWGSTDKLQDDVFIRLKILVALFGLVPFAAFGLLQYGPTAPLIEVLLAWVMLVLLFGG